MSTNPDMCVMCNRSDHTVTILNNPELDILSLSDKTVYLSVNFKVCSHCYELIRGVVNGQYTVKE